MTTRIPTYEAREEEPMILDANDFGMLPPFNIGARLTVVSVAINEGKLSIFVDTDYTLRTDFQLRRCYAMDERSDVNSLSERHVVARRTVQKSMKQIDRKINLIAVLLRSASSSLECDIFKT